MCLVERHFPRVFTLIEVLCNETVIPAKIIEEQTMLIHSGKIAPLLLAFLVANLMKIAI